MFIEIEFTKLEISHISHISIDVFHIHNQKICL